VGNVELKAMRQRFPMEVQTEANDILSFRRAHCWGADGGRSEHHSALPTTDAEKIADALRACAARRPRRSDPDGRW
jgi:hypothetical protein